MKAFLLYFSSTDLYHFVAFLAIFCHYFNFDQYLLSNALNWKKSDGFSLKSLFKRPFYRKNIIVPVREWRNHLPVLLSSLNKRIAWGLFNPCFSNALLWPAPPYMFAFYPGMQDDSTERPWLSNNVNTAATHCGKTNKQNPGHKLKISCLHLHSEKKMSSSIATYAEHMDTTGWVPEHRSCRWSR